MGEDAAAVLRARWRRQGPTRAEQLLAQGSVRVLAAGPGMVDAVAIVPAGPDSPTTTHVYRVGFRVGQWWCSCPSPRRPCWHVLAARLVTAPAAAAYFDPIGEAARRAAEDASVTGPIPAGHDDAGGAGVGQDNRPTRGPDRDRPGSP